MTTAGPPAEISWLDLDRAVRTRVARAVRKGHAVDDHRDAALAVGYAEATLDWLSRPRRLLPFYLSFGVVLVVRVIVTWTWSVASFLYPVVGFGLLRLRMPARLRRLTTARESNAELAAECGLAPVRVRLPGHAWLHPDGRRRRLLVVSLCVTLITLVVLIATGVVGALVHEPRS
jgi:hypothetical protein